MGNAGVLLRADVKFYEMGRARILEGCKYLCAVTQERKHLLVPSSFPLDVYEKAHPGIPPEPVLEAVNAQANLLRSGLAQVDIADPIERACHGLEREIGVVTFYVATRAHEAGVPLPQMTQIAQPATPKHNELLTTVQRVLDSPQAMGTIGVGIMGLMGVFAILAASSGRKAPPVLVQHGMEFADLIQQGLGQDFADVLRPDELIQPIQPGDVECDPDKPETCEEAQEAATQVPQQPQSEATPQDVPPTQDVQQAVDNITNLFRTREA